jgi:hypothetical protein
MSRNKKIRNGAELASFPALFEGVAIISAVEEL